MKNAAVPIFIFAIFTGIGCMNDSNTKIQRTEPVPATVAQPASDPNANAIQPVPQATISAPTTAQPVSAAGLNPAHGQPGHRCDISVGAPLDSKPVQTNIQPTSSTPLTAQPVSTPATTGSGLNPAHGQPGHRCDIAVGAPLNSKPAQ